MAVTQEDAREFVGGGDREQDDAAANETAARIAQSSADYDRWAEGRNLTDRIATTTVTTRDEDGNETTTDVPLVSDTATSVPEGFGGSATDDDDDDDEN